MFSLDQDKNFTHIWAVSDTLTLALWVMKVVIKKIPRSIPIYRTSFSPPVHDDFFVMSHLLGSKYSFEMAKVMENKIAYNYKLPFFNSSNIRVKTGLNILSGLGTGAGTKPVSKEKCLKRVYQYNTICYRLEGKSWIFSMQNHAQLW